MRARALVVSAVLALASCGGDGEASPVPSKVDPVLAPAEVLDGDLKLFENTGDSTRSAFADAGETSLMADGRLWEIRRAERLVGTLQITTLQPRVDLIDDRERNAIVRDILVGESTRIRVGTVEVSQFSVNDRAVYVWFGNELVQILTLRSFDGLEPESALEDVIEHQATVAAWEPLPIEDDLDEEAE